MNSLAFELKQIHKSYRHFQLRGLDLELPTGCIMGLIGPNGAGKSTTIRILMGLVRHDGGDVTVLGQPMPEKQSEIKRDIGFVSEDMRLYGGATIKWHMDFIKSIYPRWDSEYADRLLGRFNLKAEQKVKGLSHGQAVKTTLLLSLARHPRLLILDEPTTGLDPVVRHEVLRELMEILKDEERSVLMSSHNTQDVEQISDIITFVSDGAILESAEKEVFLERWRRMLLEVDPEWPIPALGRHSLSRNGRTCILTMGDYSEEMLAKLKASGASIIEVQRMTLEEIFLARLEMDGKPNVRTS
jgi:ABC-2 type transport system ATP-binding protein